jgi:hypothetical protein
VAAHVPVGQGADEASRVVKNTRHFKSALFNNPKAIKQTG